MIKYISSIIILLVLLQITLEAQIPPDYYDEAQGLTGEELKETLHIIIDDHIEFSYNDLRDFILKNTDEDPNNSDNVILLYTGRSQAKSTFGGGVNQWNREHVWAKSHGDFGNNPPAGTDAHHIRPTDVSVNGSRGNLDFDIGGTPVPEAPGCFKDGDSFEPRDAVKGDVARMIFYMATRYEGNGEPDLEVVDQVNTSPNPEHGKLSQLLLWNTMDPPDDFEINRNDVIYYQYQNNRNPFIDHPEFVDAIWGDPSGMLESAQNKVIIFPNPCIDYIILSTPNIVHGNYIISSIQGYKVKTGKLTTETTKVGIQNLIDGLYFVRIIDAANSNIKSAIFVKATN